MKKLAAIIALCMSLTGCSTSYERYQRQFYDVFNTVTIITGYTKTRQEFDKYADIIYEEMRRLHMLFDIYNDYPQLSNLKTVNDNAGIAPVEVDEDIIELLEIAKTACRDSDGAVNAVLGSVLRIWSRYREFGLREPQSALLPDMSELRVAARHTDIDGIIIDREASTVFLRDPRMSLDVGALAKGYAVQKAMDKAKAAGFTSGIINSGGEVSVVGAPMDGRTYWTVGVQGPDGLHDAVAIAGEMSVASSGNYERFFVVDGKSYGHIIDPQTLMPAERYGAVTVLHPDCGIAEMLSTAIFILPYERGLALVEQYNAEAVWISPDGTVQATDWFKD